MSDTEKIQFLVDRLWAGKCPEPERFMFHGDDMPWNPLVSIEDAFMVVEAMRKIEFYFGLELWTIVSGYTTHFTRAGKIPVWSGDMGPPGISIVNAAITALAAGAAGKGMSELA
jgi:hypothetical protein